MWAHLVYRHMQKLRRRSVNEPAHQLLNHEMQSLASVKLLQNVIVDADMETNDDFDRLYLTLSSQGVADAEVLSPEKWRFLCAGIGRTLAAEEKASVRAKLLPVALDELRCR